MLRHGRWGPFGRIPSNSGSIKWKHQGQLQNLHRAKEYYINYYFAIHKNTQMKLDTDILSNIPYSIPKCFVYVFYIIFNVQNERFLEFLFFFFFCRCLYPVQVKYVFHSQGHWKCCHISRNIFDEISSGSQKNASEVPKSQWQFEENLWSLMCLPMAA